MQSLQTQNHRSKFQAVAHQLAAFHSFVVKVSQDDLRLGRGCSREANPIARALAGHIKEELIAHAPCANDTGIVAIIAPAHFALPGFGIGTSGYSEDTSDTTSFDFPLPNWVAERICVLLRGGYIEPFEFDFALPEIFTVPEGYIPRIKMPCYPGSKNWTPKGAYEPGDLLSPLRKFH